MTNGFEQRARAAGYDERRLLCRKLLGNDLTHGGNIERIHNAHAVYPDSVCKRFEVDCRCRIALYRQPVHRVVLVAGHAGDGIIQHHHRGYALIVGNIYKPGYAGMDKRGIADNGNTLFCAFRTAGGIEAVQPGDRSTHADAGIYHRERCLSAERIAAYIAADIKIHAFKRIVQPSVRAARAKHRRARRDIAIQFRVRLFRAEYFRSDKRLIVFPHGREQSPSRDIQTELYAVGFDYIVKLLDNIQLFYPCGKALYRFNGQRVHDPELKVACALSERLARIIIGASRGNNADGGIEVFGFVYAAVKGFGVRPFGQGARSFLHAQMRLFCHGGHHDVLCDITPVFAVGDIFPFSAFNKRARMAYACRKPQKHGGVEALGKRICRLGKFKHVGAVGRFQHRNLCGYRVAARILFVLRGMHTRIVCNCADHAAVHSDIGCGIKRVGGDVQTDVLHCTERSRPAEGGTEGDLEGDFFVRRPFGIYFIVFAGGFGDLGAGSSGVSRNNAHARLIKPAGDCFVPQK